jgi:predicted RNase H-like nuclease
MNSVRLVGIDLAWGTRAHTGLAVLDEVGRLLDLADARTDDDIAAWMHTYAPGPCLVAIDAPIVVTNATGSRACERLVTHHFGRHHAGTHPANTANKLFAGGSTRALGLATRLGLALDPRSPQSRRALEVFPHAAAVALFDLPHILRYKNKRGRTLPLLQAETTKLLDHLEALDRATPALALAGNQHWQAIRTAAESATTKAALRRVEDRIDAIICAYVALLALHAPQRLHVFGDTTDGYIVTPVTEAIAEQRARARSRTEAFA